VGITLMRRELKDLRTLMEGGLAHLSWHEQRVRDPLRARVLEELASIGVTPDVALALAQQAPRTTRLEDPSHIPLALLVRHLPVVERLGEVIGGVIAVVGPTGAGKTTTIAKLAARWCLKHGGDSLALVTTDGYRIGAREQLRTYARMLGAPLYAAEGGRDLERILEQLRGRRLVLIDTAGMAPRDVRLSEQLAQLALGAVRARVLLALPAQAEVHALEDIVRSFAQVAPAACVLTKVDEAASLGAALSVILRQRLRIAYVSDGQRVPEDLHAAHQRRIWLVRRALKVKERAPPPGPAHLARAFGRGHAHA
jgi:flagellar biosynthesis protein FlhF